MSNNPTPTRIEREATRYAKGISISCHYPEDNWTITEAVKIEARNGYDAGCQAEFDRAAPVVKALFAALGILELNQIEPEIAEEFRKVLQTYKADQ